MYNIVIEVRDTRGVVSKQRETQEWPVDQDDLDRLEGEYTDNYSYPNNISAVVVNVFRVED